MQDCKSCGAGQKPVVPIVGERRVPIARRGDDEVEVGAVVDLHVEVVHAVADVLGEIGHGGFAVCGPGEQTRIEVERRAGDGRRFLSLCRKAAGAENEYCDEREQDAGRMLHNPNIRITHNFSAAPGE